MNWKDIRLETVMLTTLNNIRFNITIVLPATDNIKIVLPVFELDIKHHLQHKYINLGEKEKYCWTNFSLKLSVFFTSNKYNIGVNQTIHQLLNQGCTYFSITFTLLYALNATHKGRQTLPLLYGLLFEAHIWHQVTTLGKAWDGRWMPHCYNTYHNTQSDTNPCSAVNKGAVGQNYTTVVECPFRQQYAASAQHTAQSSLGPPPNNAQLLHLMASWDSNPSLCKIYFSNCNVLCCIDLFTE